MPSAPIPSLLPTCPRCRQPLGEVLACPSCGLTLDLLDVVYGSAEVVLERVTDARGELGEDGRRRLEEEVGAFEAVFPQVLIAVQLVSLGSAPALRPFGFWLLNRAARPGGEITRSNENGVVLVIDPPARAVGLTLGYQLEPWLPEATVERVMASASREFKHGRLADGAARILRDLAAVLRNSLRSPVAAAADSPLAPTPLAGLRRFRDGERDQAAPHNLDQHEA